MSVRLLIFLMLVVNLAYACKYIGLDSLCFTDLYHFLAPGKICVKVCWHIGGRSKNNRYGFDEIAGRDGLISFNEWARYVAKEETFPEDQLTQCSGPVDKPPSPPAITYKPSYTTFEGPAKPPGFKGIP